MNFQTILPSPPLHLVVERYWLAEAPLSPGQVLEIPVSAGVHHGIIFCCAVPHRIRYSNGTLIPLPKCYIAGHLTQNLVNVITDQSSLFGVDLKHTSLYKLLCIPPESLTDTFIDIEEALGQTGRVFRENLSEASTFEKRVTIAASFLENHLSKAKVQKGYSEHAIDMIMKYEGNISIGEIYKALHISERHLLRSFTEQVGINPKLYACIVRFNRAIKFLEKNPRAKIQDVVHRFGYFDQSHFIKDFVRFSGQNPAGYFKNHPDFNHDYFKE